MTSAKKKFTSILVVALVAIGAYVATSQPIGQPSIRYVTHDTSLSGSGVTSNPLAVNTTNIQARVGSSCSAPDSIRAIGSDGTVTCTSGTGDLTGITAGSGLSGGGTSGTPTIAVGAGSGILAAGAVTAVNLGAGLTFSSSAIVPNLTTTTCSNGSAVTAINASGVGTCTIVNTLTGVGDITGVTAGSGLTGGGTSGALTVAVNAGSGITADGTNARANLGAGLTFSGGAIVPNLAGASCSAGQSMTALGATGTGTCSNVATAGVSVQTSATTGTINDFSLSAGTTTLVFTGAAGATINGITGGSDGRVLHVINNNGAAVLIFANEAGGSTAANRIAAVGGANWTGNINSVTTLVYRDTQARWMLVKDYTFPQVNVTTNANVTGNINAAAGDLTIDDITANDITNDGNTILGNTGGDTLTVNAAASALSGLTVTGTLTTNNDTNIGNGASDDLTVLGDTASFNTTTISLGTSGTNDTVNIGGAKDTVISFLNGPSGINRYKGLHYEWSEEFTLHMGGSEVNFGNGLQWNCDVSCLSTAHAAGRYGVLVLDTNASGTSTSNDHTRIATGTFLDLANTIEVSTYLTNQFSALATNSATSSYYARWGWTDATATSSSSDVTNGCYLMYDKANTATGNKNPTNLDRWSCWCANAGTRTGYLINSTGNSDESFALGDGTIAATTWYRWRIKITTTAGTPTRAEFYKVTSSTETKVCNINTNMPAGSTLLGLEVALFPKATSSPSSKQWRLDQMLWSYDADDEREP